MHDLLIRGARIVDGTGAAAATGDVAVERGVIREVGRLGRPAARRVVAADGAVVAPGFIDLHTHSDFTLPRFPRAPAMTRQGVTTQVLGNCGFSPFPTAPATAGLLRAASAFLDAGLDWDWSDLDGYARGLAELPLACNLALLVGHGSVRVAVMGFEDRAPTTAELEAMRELVAVAMRQGAFGLSSGLIYAPGSFAETAELAELARVAAAAGGFYASHIRDEAAGLLDAMGEAIEIGRRSGAAVQLSHHKAMGRANWGRVRDSLALLERSHAGHDVLADQYPYTAGSTTLLALLPGWAVAGGVPAMRERLADPATRAPASASWSCGCWTQHRPASRSSGTAWTRRTCGRCWRTRWWRSPATAGRWTPASAACRTRAATARSCGCWAATPSARACCPWRPPSAR